MAKQVERSEKIEKWGSVGHSWVKVPNLPKHRARVKEMWSEHGEPGIVYHGPQGHIQAYQWRVR